MSTASRNCRTARGPRAKCRNALLVPGVTGEPLGHYDPSAARQGKGDDRPFGWRGARRCVPAFSSFIGGLGGCCPPSRVRSGVSKSRAGKPGVYAPTLYLLFRTA